MCGVDVVLIRHIHNGEFLCIQLTVTRWYGEWILEITYLMIIDKIS